MLNISSPENFLQKNVIENGTESYTVPLTSLIESVTESLNESRPYRPYVIKYIVAGTPQEYEAWLRRKGLDRRAYRYVSNPGMLVGIQNISGFFIGTYLNRLDIEEIQHRIKVSKIGRSKQPYTVE